MKGRKKIVFFTVLAVALAALLVGIILTGGERSESVEETMRNAVLHESDKISLFGLIDVNPSVISGFIVTAVLLICAAIIRIFVLPRFKLVPGKFQSVIEQAVEFFDNLGKSRSPRHNGFIGAYAFAAGVYIFFGTLFELFGVQVTGVTGNPVTLPAPLSDINGAISLGCLSYLVILGGGIAFNGVRGLLLTLKDFSLPISMSFRLFGALLSGLLVTELVYYYTALSFVLPVLVGVLFTLLHAVIQAYVLTLLTTMFFGEVSERPEIREREIRRTDGEPETAAE
ncbi:MAG TPA: F0F1 ATP synthase subunit A [Firmicutes bacterium]|nr:F0F1 ATP synthase subunit A [Bacillota bacterium]